MCPFVNNQQSSQKCNTNPCPGVSVSPAKCNGNANCIAITDEITCRTYTNAKGNPICNWS